MKVCNTCKKELPLTEFQKSGTQPSGKVKYKAHCKQCSSVNDKKNSHKRLFEAMQELNMKLECELCGYNKNLAALDFHHLDSEEKSFHIRSNSNRSKESIKEELKKCVVLCANCHREHHNPELELDKLSG